jgi:hypothetical protein
VYWEKHEGGGDGREKITFGTFVNPPTREPIVAEGSELDKCCNVVGQTQYIRDEILRSLGSQMVKM